MEVLNEGLLEYESINSIYMIESHILELNNEAKLFFDYDPYLMLTEGFKENAKNIFDRVIAWIQKIAQKVKSFIQRVVMNVQNKIAQIPLKKLNNKMTSNAKELHGDRLANSDIKGIQDVINTALKQVEAMEKDMQIKIGNTETAIKIFKSGDYSGEAKEDSGTDYAKELDTLKATYKKHASTQTKFSADAMFAYTKNINNKISLFPQMSKKFEGTCKEAEKKCVDLKNAATSASDTDNKSDRFSILTKESKNITSAISIYNNYLIFIGNAFIGITGAISKVVNNILGGGKDKKEDNKDQDQKKNVKK